MHQVTSRCANAMEDSAGEAPLPRMRMFSITAQYQGPAIIIRQYYALSARSNMHIVASHQHTLSGPPAHHTTIPPAWHYLATRPLTKYSFITVVCTYVSLYIKSTQFNLHTLYPHPVSTLLCQYLLAPCLSPLKLETKVYMKVRNHGEGPYWGLLLVASAY